MFPVNSYHVHYESMPTAFNIVRISEEKIVEGWGVRLKVKIIYNLKKPVKKIWKTQGFESEFEMSNKFEHFGNPYIWRLTEVRLAREVEYYYGKRVVDKAISIVHEYEDYKLAEHLSFLLGFYPRGEVPEPDENSWVLLEPLVEKLVDEKIATFNPVIDRGRIEHIVQKEGENRFEISEDKKYIRAAY